MRRQVYPFKPPTPSPFLHRNKGQPIGRKEALCSISPPILFQARASISFQPLGAAFGLTPVAQRSQGPQPPQGQEQSGLGSSSAPGSVLNLPPECNPKWLGCNTTDTVCTGVGGGRCGVVRAVKPQEKGRVASDE